MTRRCNRFGSSEHPLSSYGEVEHERLFDGNGNGVLRELDDLFRAVLLLLLSGAPPTGAPDVLGGGIVYSVFLVAEVCKNASVAFVMPKPFRTLLLMSS